MTPREELESLRRLAELEAKERGASIAAPAPTVPQRTTLEKLGHGFGLAGRTAVQGFASLPGVVNDAIGGIYNTGANAIQGEGKGFRFQPTSYALGNLMDTAGVSKPENATERVAVDGATMAIGALSGASAADRASRMVTSPQAQAVLTKLASRPVIQATSGAGAGTAGGITREEGGGPWQQFFASLAGGLATPLAVDKLAGLASGLGAKLREIRSPEQLTATLRLELERAGVRWDDLGATVKVQLQNDAKRAVYSGQPLDGAALRRLADYRTVGATPLVGDITQDPLLLTRQRNLSKTLANLTEAGPNSLPMIENQNANRVIDAVTRLGNSADDAFATGQRIVGGVQARDAALQAQERALYGAARDQAGRPLELDRGAFLNQAFSNLARENKTAFLPEQVGNMLNQLGKGKVTVGGQEFPVPFNVDVIDNLKTMLSSASRAASNDGNQRAALAAVRDALEMAQPRAPAATGPGLVTQQQAAATRAGDAAAEAMQAFDTARSFARDRRQWQESARFIEDALNGAAPDKFVQKHIIGGTVDELARIRQSFGNDPQVMASIKQQLVDYIRTSGGMEDGFTKFSSAAMQKAFDRLGERKLGMFFDNQEIQQLRSAINVGRSMQVQPIGSAVNNSNTAGTMLGQLLSYGRNIPVIGPNVTQPLEGLAVSMQLNRMKNLTPGLLAQQPTAPALPNVLTGGLLAAPALQPGQ